MSWNAYLSDDRGHSEGSWNYTHNCNAMIEDALGVELVGATKVPFWASMNPNTGMGHHSWWDVLDGKAGMQGWRLLSHVVDALERDPCKYRAMNPPNGWGSYDTLLEVLREMRDASVKEWPTEWRVHG